MTVDELKAKVEILVALNAQLAKRLADAGRPSREDHWERKCREHLAEVHALRAKCAILESEQNLKGLRKDLAKAESMIAKLRDQRQRDVAAIERCKLGEYELQRVLGASDIESATSAADRVMKELHERRSRRCTVGECYLDAMIDALPKPGTF